MERQYDLERANDDIAMKWDTVPWHWYIHGVQNLIARAREDARTHVTLNVKRKIIIEEINAALAATLEQCTKNNDERTHFFIGYILGNLSDLESARAFEKITGLPADWWKL